MDPEIVEAAIKHYRALEGGVRHGEKLTLAERNVPRPMDPYLVNLLPAVTRLHYALDIGAGPITILGDKFSGYDGKGTLVERKVQVVAVDALGAEYAALLAELGIVPNVRTLPIPAERILDYFPPNSFDMVYSHNALDHMTNPQAALGQAFWAARPEARVVIDVYANEGQANCYHGMHQWDVDIREGRAVMAAKDKPPFDLGDFGRWADKRSIESAVKLRNKEIRIVFGPRAEE